MLYGIDIDKRKSRVYLRYTDKPDIKINVKSLHSKFTAAALKSIDERELNVKVNDEVTKIKKSIESNPIFPTEIKKIKLKGLSIDGIRNSIRDKMVYKRAVEIAEKELNIMIDKALKIFEGV